MKLKRHHYVIGAVTLMVVMFGWFSTMFNPVNMFKAVHGLPRGNPPSPSKLLKAGTESPTERMNDLKKPLYGKTPTP